MRKKGFTLIEVVVALALFLVAIIPITKLTRGVTLAGSSFSRNSSTPENIPGESAPIVSEDYSGDVLRDFLNQVERTGYSYLKTDLLNGATTISKDYMLNMEKTGKKDGCFAGQYYLTPVDSISQDPYTGKVKCFSQDNLKDLSNLVITMVLTKGKAINLRTLEFSDSSDIALTPIQNPPFIYVEAFMGGDKRDKVMSPFQDPCVIKAVL